MKLKDKEINFKISRIEDSRNLEKALKDMVQKENAISTTDEKGNLSDVLTAMLDMFREFFKTVCGEDVLADCDDVTEAKEMYYLFLDEVAEQKTMLTAPFSPRRVR